MEVVQVLSVDEKVEHVKSLSADLETSLHPVESRRLEAVERGRGGTTKVRKRVGESVRIEES